MVVENLPTKGWNVKLTLDGSEVGYASSVSWDVATNIEEYYELGSPKPAVIVEGNYEVSGTLEKAFVDAPLLTLIAGSSGLNLGQTSLTLTATAPKNVESGKEYYEITLSGVKLETVSNEFPQDGFLTDSIDFKATDIKIEKLTAP